MHTNEANVDFSALTTIIKTWALEHGFQAVGISDTALHTEALGLQQYLDDGRHGSMDYMARHGMLRAEPAQLVPGTLRIISVRLDYTPEAAANSWQVMAASDKAFLSRYALGRDYHKVLRAKLQKLATRIEGAVNAVQYRVFTDSAPVMEVALRARQAWAGAVSTRYCWRARQAPTFFWASYLLTCR